MLDGELMIPDGEAEDFEALQQRIHPAASRVQMLAEETPARFVAFDLLAHEDTVAARRSRSPRGGRCSSGWSADPVILIDQHHRPRSARPWLQEREGVVAKRWTTLPTAR